MDKETIGEMDIAAKEAEKELNKIDKKAVEVIGEWLTKHYKYAGYRRLCRLLIK